jgi:hypothetical protein
MERPISEERVTRWRPTTMSALILIGCLFGAASCSTSKAQESLGSSQSNSALPVPGAGVKEGGSTTSTVGAGKAPSGNSASAATIAEVKSAWTAAVDAFSTAARTADPDEPALLATTTEPLLDSTRSTLAAWRAAGEVSVGSTKFGPLTVKLVNANRATVDVCLYSNDILVSKKTGDPVAGILGEKGYGTIDSTMVATTGGWKLADQRVTDTERNSARRYSPAPVAYLVCLQNRRPMSGAARVVGARSRSAPPGVDHPPDPPDPPDPPGEGVEDRTVPEVVL